MNGSYIIVEYKGKEMNVFISHGIGKRSKEWLKEKAFRKLRVIEAEHTGLSLDEIQKRLDKAIL